jgi:hypothetical protein
MAARNDYEIVNGLHAAGAVGMYDASVTKDENGKVHVNKDETATRHGAWGGAAVGAVIGILFPPALIGNALVGMRAARHIAKELDLSSEDLDEAVLGSRQRTQLSASREIAPRRLGKFPAPPRATWSARRPTNPLSPRRVEPAVAQPNHGRASRPDRISAAGHATPSVLPDRVIQDSPKRRQAGLPLLFVPLHREMRRRAVPVVCVQQMLQGQRGNPLDSYQSAAR